MDWMNLHHLKYFLVIAEEGSLSAASKKLLVGQPALSAQLKQFENWLGTPLFDRKGKKLLITQAGEYVLKYARRIKNLEEELISNLGNEGQFLKKELVVGVQESIPKSAIAQSLTAIRRGHNVRLKIIEGTGEELFELLMNSKLDIFIANFKPMSASKEILYKSLGKEEISVWGSKDYLKYKKDFPYSLHGLNFILPGFEGPLRHDFEKYMLEEGIEFEVSIEAQDTALQKELASRGEGLVLLGEESAKLWATAGRLHRIGKLNFKEEYWLGMVKRTIDNKHMKSVLSSL